MECTALHGFKDADLSQDEVCRLAMLATEARGDIIAMTTLAGSGHPGGSLSSIDIFLVLWSYANVSPAGINDPNRDRIVISHGHTASAVYAALGRLGYFEPDQVISSFRKAGSIFGGHAEPDVPGVEWACGNLGQGLSAVCGFALASRLTGNDYRVYCVMGDGEQQKGQIAEARRFACKYRLTNLTAIVDCNGLQAMGSVDETMPIDLQSEWRAAGWRVVEIDGHNYAMIYAALKEAAKYNESPTVIMARTTMGHGVSFIEDKYEYHGKVLTIAECEAALQELNLSGDRLLTRPVQQQLPSRTDQVVESKVQPGTPRIYFDAVDCRSAFGNALTDIARENPDVPMAVLDCDLSVSLKTDSFSKLRPRGFIQCGIQEHSAASIAGALSKSGVLSFFAEFGVFGIDETYNQHRMNDINGTSLKLVCTHCGLDVGEDGRTHQCIDYISLVSNLHGFKLIVPADANQTDLAVRFMATTRGNFLLALGRSKTPIMHNEQGRPLFADGYTYQYGRADWIRHGNDGTIITAGNMVARAVEAHELLGREGLRIGVLNVSSPLSLDADAIRQASETGLIVTCEDHNVHTGLGSLVASHLLVKGLQCKFLMLGITKYGVSSSPDENYRLQGLDPESITNSIRVKSISTQG